MLSVPRAYLLSHPERKLTPRETRRFFALVRGRERREPVAYLTGHREFYGLDFFVNRAVLIPRPETETIIEAVLQKLPVTSHRLPITNYRLPITIIDIGTGSGAIAVTLAKHLPNATVYATDNSPAALRVAQKNAARHRVNIIFKKGNLLEPIASIFRNYSLLTTHYQLLITANLPYVPTREWKTLQPEIRKYEPRSAIDGGRDGLKYYRQLFSQLKKLPITDYQLPITLFLEFDPEQTRPLGTLIKKSFPTASIEIKKDLAGRNRVLVLVANG